MIAYVDSSVLARTYLSDEGGSDEARRLLADGSVAKYTGGWTRIEVSGAIVRAARAGRPIVAIDALAELDADVREGGRVRVIAAPSEDVETTALDLARRHGVRTLDALHLALATIVLPLVADRGEPLGFASRDGDQAVVAESLGFAAL